jgi:3-hydroxymyristoyl/3-hydroxydecanoyl-(acyl carrier protein) dehydratase
VVLRVINDMRFLVPVVPGDRMEMDVQIPKIAGDIALVEGVVTVDGTMVARGKLGFARRTLNAKQPSPGPAGMKTPSAHD